MHFLGEVTVRFKKSVLEPQGQAIMLSLKEKSYSEISLIRVGKIIEVHLEANNQQEARNILQKMADDLLYNPVMETCEFSVKQV